MKNILKREIPSDNTKSLRKEILKNSINLKAKKPVINTIRGLEYGNEKTGVNGLYYDNVFVWNIPMIICCPGCSEWCKENCYNGDIRSNVYPLDKWCENLWWYENDKVELTKRINTQLRQAIGTVAVRIHSSGDFFSTDYIEFWKNIILLNPSVSFWAYTRSWSDKSLLQSIEGLIKINNLNLYYSYDKTMGMIPRYKKALVFDSMTELESYQPSESIICPEQIGAVKSCADCGICMSNKGKDIKFILH